MSEQPERLLPDTHYWLWLEFGHEDQLTQRGLLAIRDAAAKGLLCVSVVSVWEVAMLESKHRVHLDIPCDAWIARALGTAGMELLALTPEIAIESTRLPGDFRSDPADCILVATARRMGATLMTRDHHLLEYGRRHHVRVFRG